MLFYWCLRYAGKWMNGCAATQLVTLGICVLWFHCHFAHRQEFFTLDISHVPFHRYYFWFSILFMFWTRHCKCFSRMWLFLVRHCRVSLRKWCKKKDFTYDLVIFLLMPVKATFEALYFSTVAHTLQFSERENFIRPNVNVLFPSPLHGRTTVHNFFAFSFLFIYIYILHYYEFYFTIFINTYLDSLQLLTVRGNSSCTTISRKYMYWAVSV